jgi:Pro-kumamolisin, activation domain
MAKNVAPIIFASAFLAIAAPGQTAPGSSTKSDSKPQISQFVLYAERSIKIGEHSRAEDGDIGVRSKVAPKEGGSQLTVGKHDRCRNLFSPSTAIENDADVHDVWTDSLIRDPDSKMGAENKFPALDMPPLPLALGSGGGSDVNIAHDKHQSLKPGTYGAIRLDHNSALSLTAGKYIFASLKMEEDSKLVGDKKGVDVRIGGELWMDKEARIGPRDDEVKANDFSIAVAGTDPTLVTQDTRLTPTTVVSIGRKAHIHGLLAAPHGTVWMADEAGVKGAVAAFDIIVGDNVEVERESGFAVSPPGQQGSQQLHGYLGFPSPATPAPVAAPVPQDAKIALAIGLPVRDPQGLKTFIRQVSDPKNANYRKYMTQAQFYSTYGATNSDYHAVQNWASSQGFAIKATYPNNLLLSVSTTAQQIEQGLYVNLVYRVRRDGSQFISVDREPSLDLTVPILYISGLNDFYTVRHHTGTGGGGALYRAADIRNAYLGVGSSCQKLDGTGQTIGIVDFDTFNPSDVAGYDALQIPHLNPANVKIVAVEGGNPLANSNVETTLDLAMAQAMAPAAKVLLFQGSTGATGYLDDILHAMATFSPPLTVASCSLGFGASDSSQQALDELAAQGVSFYTASGDSGDIGDPHNNEDMNTQVLVGGTFLTTNPLTTPLPTPVYPPNYYVGESTWNQGLGGGATGGGIMDGTDKTVVCGCTGGGKCCNTTPVPIPDYQLGVSMATNGGSTTFRNYPDVAMLADNVEIFFGGSTSPIAGTSVAAPLWAGFTALLNQQAVNNGVGSLGFANPAIYAIGLTRGTANDLYATSFNDVADGGNNANRFSTGFTTVAGYDLTTGWGTPNCGLINLLAAPMPMNPPPTFQVMQVHISNGDDGIRDDSTGLLAVFLAGALQPVILNEFHPPNSSGWDPKGVAHDMLLSFPAPITPSMMGNLTFSLPCCDDWSIGGLDVRLLNPGSSSVCVFHGESLKNPDGSINTELGRLTHNNNPMAVFTPGGCPTAPIASFSSASIGFGTVPPGQTVTQSITLSNIGNAPLVLSSAVVSQNPPFSLDQTTCSNGATALPVALPAGGACSFSVSFQAPAGPAPSASLTFTDDAANANVASVFAGSAFTQTIPLNGSGSSATPQALPVTEVIFEFETGDDDLRQGSELDVSFFKPGAAAPFETGVLKNSGAPKFDNNTQNTVIYPLATGPHPLSDIGSISISLNNSGNDEWHIFGLNVMADSPGGPQNCLYDIQAQPVKVLNSGTPSMLIVPNSGCP